MESTYFGSRYDSVTLTFIVLVPRTGTAVDDCGALVS